MLMNYKKNLVVGKIMIKKQSLILVIVAILCTFSLFAQQRKSYEPWIWPSEPPGDCPFEQSEELVGVALTINYRHYTKNGRTYADTWYPTWAANDTLYSPWTDGACPRLDGTLDFSQSGHVQYQKDMVYNKRSDYKLPLQATTGHAVMIGNDPLNLKIHSLGTFNGDPAPYQGRYPCGSLVHDGIWYYGTYCLAPAGTVNIGGFDYNWPWLGPLVGFRTSTDYGLTWTDTSHTPEKPLFGETGMWGHPVKMGAPHFVDFGKNMEHSPDGKAYLVGMGAEENDSEPRNANLSWITADQIYMCRVTPSIENINDISKYEFFGGHSDKGDPIWTDDFQKIKPLIDWNNNCGCVTMTYNAPLKKYIMTITDGWPTVARMNSYFLESDNITGPWKLVSYLKDFGEQAYFLNFPTKFISDDGKTMWLCYSGNFAPDWNDMKITSNPPGSAYGLVMQEMILLDKNSYKKYKDNPRPIIE
jgi:hypothetical protein